MASSLLRAHVRQMALEAFTEIARAEYAGDEFQCLDDNDCPNPGGHLFLTSCGATACVHCERIAWR